jgi:hypothetical protein
VKRPGRSLPLREDNERGLLAVINVALGVIESQDAGSVSYELSRLKAMSGRTADTFVRRELKWWNASNEQSFRQWR